MPIALPSVFAAIIEENIQERYTTKAKNKSGLKNSDLLMMGSSRKIRVEFVFFLFPFFDGF